MNDHIHYGEPNPCSVEYYGDLLFTIKRPT